MPQLKLLSFPDLIDLLFTVPEVEAEIHRRYEVTGSILVCDFTGMVRRTRADGIVYALALARAAERALMPAISDQGGEIIKRVADTFFAVFPSPATALLAALDANRRAHTFNHDRTGHIGDGRRNDPIWPGIGLGHGTLLVVPREDVYGDEVNRAFVLGEDVAAGGETLCTEAFLQALGTLPDGVGAFRAPHDREIEAGFPFQVLKDYRED